MSSTVARQPGRHQAWLDLVPGLAFAALYVATASRNLTLTHDSVFYLTRIAEGRAALDPNHLIFEPLIAVAWNAAERLGAGLGVQAAAQAVNAIAGALALQCGYLIAVRRLGVARGAAAAATAAAGFTYGVWYYSTTVETYIIPLALLAAAFYLFTRPSLTLPAVAVGTLAHALATLVHQSAVLFAPVAVLAIYTSRRGLRNGAPGPPIGSVAAYMTLYGLLVVGSYAAAAIADGQRSPADIVRWSRGHGAESSFWSRPPRAFVEAGVGFGRALFGGHYVLAVDGVESGLQTYFPNKYLRDEVFLVRDLPSRHAVALLAVTAVAAGLTLALAIAGAVRALRAAVPANRRAFRLMLLWAAIYVGFFTFWDPQNSDFWIVQSFLIWYLIAATVAGAGRRGTGSTLALALIACALLTTTGLGIIRFTTQTENDFYAVYLRNVPQIVGPDDVLMVGDDWPIAGQIGFRFRRPGIYLTQERAVRRPREIAAQLDATLRRGARIFVSPDVFEPADQTRRLYGEPYVAYAREVAGYLEDTSTASAVPGQLELLEVRRIRM